MASITISVTIDVLDEKVLRDYAIMRYGACWGAESALAWQDTEPSIEEIAFEALIGSNEGPMPNDIGVEIEAYSH